MTRRAAFSGENDRYRDEPFDAAEVVDKALAIADALVARLKEVK